MRFEVEETPVREMAVELELSEELNKLKSENVGLREELNKLKTVSEVENAATDTVTVVPKVHDSHTDEVTVDATNDDPGNKDVVISVEEKKRDIQKKKKVQDSIQFPKVGQDISYRVKGSKEWATGRIIRTFKKTSKHKNFRHVKLNNGDIAEIDFLNNVEDWKELLEEPLMESEDEVFYISEMFGSKSEEYEAFPVKVIPKSDYGRPEVTNAMQSELDKYKTFDAFDEVHDEGQYSVPIRWVVTEQKENGKGEPYKARMCIRGD